MLNDVGHLLYRNTALVFSTIKLRYIAANLIELDGKNTLERHLPWCSHIEKNIVKYDTWIFGKFALRILHASDFDNELRLCPNIEMVPSLHRTRRLRGRLAREMSRNVQRNFC